MCLVCASWSVNQSLLSDSATFDTRLLAFLAAHDMHAIRTEMSADLQSSSSPAAAAGSQGKSKNSKSATLRLPLFHHQQHKERKKKDGTSGVADGDRAASPAAAKSKSAILKTIKKLGAVAGKKNRKSSKNPTGDL